MCVCVCIVNIQYATGIFKGRRKLFQNLFGSLGIYSYLCNA